jgi:hypothetical protein
MELNRPGVLRHNAIIILLSTGVFKKLSPTKIPGTSHGASTSR